MEALAVAAAPEHRGKKNAVFWSTARCATPTPEDQQEIVKVVLLTNGGFGRPAGPSKYPPPSPQKAECWFGPRLEEQWV